MATTFLLDRDTWDLCVDAQGNIAIATEPYAVEQDVASACRLFTGELYYGGDKGVPYFADALGKPIPAQLLKAQLVKAALTVPTVKSAKVFLTILANRTVGGQVQFSTSAGNSTVTL